MTIPSESYLKVQYELRPAKQVERRMIIDALHKLVFVGFDIEEYKYVGLGSIYFIDFILFHKFLGIKKMISAEFSNSIQKRVHFNKPYDFIEIFYNPIGEIIPTLNKEIQHFLWLDYDYKLDTDIIADVKSAATFLSKGSILVVTVDVEPPENEYEGPENWKDYFEKIAGDYLGITQVKDFAKTKLPFHNIHILYKAILDGLSGRDIDFYPIFNFSYADGHEMITIGGILGAETELRRIQASKISETAYSRMNLNDPPYRIEIPKVTRKERLYLDSHMPCSNNWTPELFEFDQGSIRAYREIYRFFPAFAELLL